MFMCLFSPAAVQQGFGPNTPKHLVRPLLTSLGSVEDSGQSIVATLSCNTGRGLLGGMATMLDRVHHCPVVLSLAVLLLGNYELQGGEEGSRAPWNFIRDHYPEMQML